MALDAWRCPSCQEVTAREPKPNFSLRDALPSLGALSSPSTTTRADETHALHVTRVPLDERAQPRGPPKCDEHDEPLKYMCTECNALSCTDCMNFGKHKGHAHELVTTVAEAKRKQLVDAVAEAEAAEAEVARVVDAVQQVVDGTSGTLATARRQIEEEFEQVRNELAHHERACIAEVEAFVSQKIARLTSQLGSLGMRRSRLHAARELADATIAMAPAEVTAGFNRCLETLHAAIGEPADIDVEPVVDASVPSPPLRDGFWIGLQKRHAYRLARLIGRAGLIGRGAN
jgi:hypothetical protein